MKCILKIVLLSFQNKQKSLIRFIYLKLFNQCLFSDAVSKSKQVVSKSRLIKVVHTCNVTAFRFTVSWQCGRGSWPRNLSKVGYGVTLRACLGAVGIWPSHKRYDTVTAWAGSDVQHDKSPPSAPLAFFTFMLHLAPVTNWEPHGVTLAGYCYAMRHGMKVQIVTPFRIRHLQRYGVTVRGNVTGVHPTLGNVMKRSACRRKRCFQILDLFCHSVNLIQSLRNPGKFSIIIQSIQPRFYIWTYRI
jgi:hypothetical protein